MANTTYFVVLPFVRNEEGDLCPDQAIECSSRSSAAARARELAARKAGAVAFSRTGDPNVGDYSEPEIIARLGEVPEDLEVASGA